MDNVVYLFETIMFHSPCTITIILNFLRAFGQKFVDPLEYPISNFLIGQTIYSLNTMKKTGIGC